MFAPIIVCSAQTFLPPRVCQTRRGIRAMCSALRSAFSAVWAPRQGVLRSTSEEVVPGLPAVPVHAGRGGAGLRYMPESLAFEAPTDRHMVNHPAPLSIYGQSFELQQEESHLRCHRGDPICSPLGLTAFAELEVETPTAPLPAYRYALPPKEQKACLRRHCSNPVCRSARP